MKAYQTPSIQAVFADFFQSVSQYQLIVTQEGCPNLANAPTSNVSTFSAEGVLGCGDAEDLADAQSQPNETIFVTCTNISGNYNVTLLLSQSHFSSGLSCPPGETTLAVPLDISPDLPEDCIIDTLSSGSGDVCG